MAAPCPMSRSVAATLLALSAGLSLAGEHAPVKEAPAAAAAASSAQRGEPKELKETREGKEAKDAKPAPHALQDPMDMLREKLAARLGASKAPGADGANVVRVVSKPALAGVDEHRATAAALRPARPKAAAGASAAEPAAHAAEAAHPAHWDYAGSAGPEAWGQMKPEFAKCSSGARQSPIDIRDGIRVDLEPVQFDYKPSGFRVVDNGHTVQVNVAPGNSIEVMGRRYDLVQFHFHRPSEERIDGRQFDMVVHLVHKDIDGRLAVVAVLLERGSAQPLIQNVWNNLPLEKGDEVAARGAINVDELLPVERGYFTYMGSLTTPPCSEGVLWMVMRKPVQLSAEQIGIFARLYPMNARPIQSAAGRLIKESN